MAFCFSKQHEKKVKYTKFLKKPERTAQGVKWRIKC